MKIKGILISILLFACVAACCILDGAAAVHP